MKRFFQTLLFILFFQLVGGNFAFAFNPTFVFSGSTASPSCDTSQQSETAAQDANKVCGRYADRVRLASPFVYTGTNGKAICKIRLYASFTGSSEHLYEAAIMDDSGGSPNSVLGTSDTYDLSGIGSSETTFNFEFSTPTSALTSSNRYYVVLISHSDADDSSNYAAWYATSTGTTKEEWDYNSGDGWIQVETSHTFKYVIYSQ